MKKQWIKVIAFLVIVSAAIVSSFVLEKDYLDIHHLGEYRQQLLSFVSSHYVEAALSFILLFISTALFLPGALALSIAGGLLFGTLPCVLYVNIGATTGAVLAFITARFVIGGWFQARFSGRLQRLNREIARHGKSYLLVLRIFPIAPFCVINYCAGITEIRLRTFIWTTSLGILPGSVIHAFMGQQLRSVNAVSDVLSWKVLLALLLLALFALLPVIRHHLPALKKLARRRLLHR